MVERVLITGVTGQDRVYLSEFLLHKGYEVHASSAAHYCSTEPGLITRITKNGFVSFFHLCELNGWQLFIKNYSRRLAH